MIYAHAETAEDIANYLRMADSEENLQSQKVADRLMGKKSIEGEGKGIIVIAPRRIGKTTELLRYAESRHRWGNFAVVCGHVNQVQNTIRQHFLLFNKVGQAEIVAARLLGKQVAADPVNPPLVVTADSTHLLRGSGRPVYVDDWDAIDSRIQESIVASGMFVAGVASS